MRKYIYIGIGGFLGAVLRYLIMSVQIENYQGLFPINTLAINLSGSFLLAFLLTIDVERLEINADLRLGAATGFLGAFTTFSAVCKEISFMIIQGAVWTAITYAALSIFLGLAAAFGGFSLARKIATSGKISADREVS